MERTSRGLHQSFFVFIFLWNISKLSQRHVAQTHFYKTAAEEEDGQHFFETKILLVKEKKILQGFWQKNAFELFYVYVCVSTIVFSNDGTQT